MFERFVNFEIFRNIVTLLRFSMQEVQVVTSYCNINVNK